MPNKDYQKYKAARDNPSRSESFSERYVREKREEEFNRKFERDYGPKSRSEEIWDNDDFKDM